MGASVSTIKATLVLREGFNVIKMRSMLEGFGGNSVESPGSVEEIVTVDNLKPRVPAMRIVPDTAQRYDVILGRSFTEAPDLTYTRVGDELTFAELDSEIVNRQVGARAHSLEKKLLEPGSINFINVIFNAEELKMPIMNFGEKRETVEVGEWIGESIMSIKTVEGKDPRYDAISPDEIVTDEDVTAELKKELVNLLNNYRECVARNVCEIGKTERITMEIETDNARRGRADKTIPPKYARSLRPR